MILSTLYIAGTPFKFQTVADGLTLSLPDVWPKSPLRGKAFCQEHCDLSETADVPTELNEFLKYCKNGNCLNCYCPVLYFGFIGATIVNDDSHESTVSDGFIHKSTGHVSLKYTFVGPKKKKSMTSLGNSFFMCIIVDSSGLGIGLNTTDASDTLADGDAIGTLADGDAIGTLADSDAIDTLADGDTIGTQTGDVDSISDSIYTGDAECVSVSGISKLFHYM